MMAQTVTLDGNTISSSEVMAAVNGDAIIELTEGAWNRIIAARNTIDEILESDETVYGINTGFGSLVNTKIAAHSTAKYRQHTRCKSITAHQIFYKLSLI